MNGSADLRALRWIAKGFMKRKESDFRKDRRWRQMPQAGVNRGEATVGC